MADRHRGNKRNTKTTAPFETWRFPPTTFQQAQELIFEARETGSRRSRRALARRALRINPDCADAYVVLAQEEEDAAKALRLYLAGIQAGERALGRAFFKTHRGHFWGILETRPYMRARAGLAECLWELGQRVLAIEHYKGMLRLNPNDNQGIRYILINCLLEEKMDTDAKRLLARYKNDIVADWPYSRALCQFRMEGPSRRAARSLAQAFESNPFVPEYLLETVRMPRRLPDSISFGGRDEAVSYVSRALPAWKTTPYVLDWLRDETTGRP